MTLVGRLRRAVGLMDHSVCVVVLTVPEERLRAMDVATGPCVPLPGRRRPLAGVTRQDGGELPRHTAALHTALTGRPAEHALELVERRGPGALYRCTPDFVDAMSDAVALLDRLRAQDEADGDRDLTRWRAQWDAYERAWLEAGRWPWGVTGLSQRLARLGWAATARDRGHPLWCWAGPTSDWYDAGPSRRD